MKVIQKVGILGAGQMGAGIAYVCAAAGYRVALVDKDQESLTKGHEKIQGFSVQYSPANACDQSQKDILGRIEFSLDVNALISSQMVIEAIPENEDLKIEALKHIGTLIGADVPICTNTSALSVTRLSKHVPYPERFMGLHFMNPVPLMPLVELVQSFSTCEDAAHLVSAFVASLGKTAVECADTPGFIVNRLLIPMINEAIYIFAEGAAPVEDIDEAMRLGTNHPMGPLELADLIGLDTCLAIMRRLYEGFSDSKYRPCPLLVQYVDAGRLGRKSKKGFYDY